MASKKKPAPAGKPVQSESSSDSEEDAVPVKLTAKVVAPKKVVVSKPPSAAKTVAKKPVAKKMSAKLVAPKKVVVKKPVSSEEDSDDEEDKKSAKKPGKPHFIDQMIDSFEDSMAGIPPAPGDDRSPRTKRLIKNILRDFLKEQFDQ